MLASSPFFKLFPPPAFLLMPHAGLDISDDAITCIAYTGSRHKKKISLFGSEELPDGLIDGGDIKDEKELISRLTAFAKKHGISRVKVSIPEEKSYLFGTEVPSGEFNSIEQNIEFKLEENVPLQAPNALFYFDIVPSSIVSSVLKVNVSVVPKTYIEHYTSILKQAGLNPGAFEVAPKSIARAIATPGIYDTKLIVHIMKKKAGIYIVSGNVVDFASTVSLNNSNTDQESVKISTEALTKEIDRIQSYWVSHGNGQVIEDVALVGRDSPAIEPVLEHLKESSSLSVCVADVWKNAFDTSNYLPPISKEDSLIYAVAAGLAMDPSAGD